MKRSGTGSWLPLAAAVAAAVVAVTAVAVVEAPDAATTRSHVRRATIAVAADADAHDPFLLRRLPQPVEAPAAYVAAREQILRSLEATRARGLPAAGAVGRPWTWLGPGNRGGRTRALAIDPRNPDVMYVGGVTGGIWKTRDGGRSWRPLIDTFANIAIGVIEMDPTDPDVLYAGTGEPTEAYAQDHRGLGILRSTDAGASWEFLRSTRTPDFFWVGDVKVSPTDNRRIYAATHTGVWRSVDGGDTWEQVLQNSFLNGCVQLAIRTDRDPDTLFASCGTFGPAAVFHSADGGDRWEQVLPRAGDSTGFIAIAISPSRPDVMYASAASGYAAGLGAYALLRSTGGGEAGTWQIVNRPTLQPGHPNWLGWCEYDTTDGQGWFAHTLAVDPVNANRLWVGGIDMYRSDDGGRTLNIVSYWWLDHHYPRPDATPYMHADHHGVYFHPRYDGRGNQSVFFTNDGGVFRTDNAAARLTNRSCPKVQNGALQITRNDLNPVTYRSLNNGLGIAQFVGGDVSDDGTFLLGGTQDNGSITARVADGPNAWREVWQGDGGFAHIDSKDRYLYVTNYGFSMRRKRFGGADFEDATGGIQDTGEFYVPFEMDPNDPRVLWTGGTTPWRSSNRGGLWKRAASKAFPGNVVSIGVSASNDDVVFAGLASGMIYKTSDAAAATPTWEPVGASFPRAPVSAVAVDPTTTDNVYAVFDTFDGNQIWRSDDGGRSWQASDRGLPEIAVNAVAVNPRNPQMVYAGTDAGVFESLDNGGSWHPVNERFAATIVAELVFRTGSSELYAFTHGRGAYSIDVGSSAG